MTLIKRNPYLPQHTRNAKNFKADPLPKIDFAGLMGLSASTELVPVNPRPAPRKQEMPTAKCPPRRGFARPFSGRAPMMPDIPVTRGSTGQIKGFFPFLYGQGLPPVGAYMGIDTISGGSFSCHPIEWLHRGLITNPNVLITGIPGAGKSATIKALSLRLMAYGVRTMVLGDLKNEYAPLARSLGVEPVELGPGLSARLNPLDAGPLGDNLPEAGSELDERLAEIHRRRVQLLASLVETRLERTLTATEEAALSLAIEHATGQATGASTLVNPTIPEVWRLLHDPRAEMVNDLRFPNVAELRTLIRPAVDALGTMVRGSLAGLFDEATTVRLDFDAPIQTVDISRMRGRADQTVAMLLACVSSWGQAAIDDPAGGVRMVVRDELWRAMRIAAMVRKLDSDLRLSRAQGTIQMLATHRLADFEAVGAADSEEAAIARSLIGSCEVRVCHAQDTKPLEMTKDAIGLSDTECAHIGSWTAEQIGYGLWKIGRTASHVVHTVLTPAEQRLFWTNERMAV